VDISELIGLIGLAIDVAGVLVILVAIVVAGIASRAASCVGSHTTWPTDRCVSPSAAVSCSVSSC